MDFKYNKEMKVIHFLYELKFSGAEIMYVDAAPVFQKLGCELAVVNTAPWLGEYAPEFETAGYKVYHWPYPKSYKGRWQYYKKVIAFLKTEGYDVVHIHSSALKWGMSYCAWKAGCRAVYTFHNVFRSHWYSYPLHWWLRWSAKNIFNCVFQTISDSVCENEKSYYHNETTKIYNWYGSDRFFPANEGEKSEARKELGIPESALVVVSVGGCSPIKRHTDVIRALPEVVGKRQDVTYLHLGDGGSLQEEKELAAKLHVQENVRFCGNQKDVRKYLIASDIYVMTSKFEGIPITTIEAMASGVLAILYDVPGLRDFNAERECAVLIPEDYGLLAKEIIALSQDKRLQSELTANAQALVNEKYNMRTNAQKIYELYRK